MPHALSQNDAWIDMGVLSNFLRKIERLQSTDSPQQFRFSPSFGDFWVFEVEDDEDILGGVLAVQEGRVYAISEDVYGFVTRTFAKRK